MLTFMALSRFPDSPSLGHRANEDGSKLVPHHSRLVQDPLPSVGLAGRAKL